MTTSADVFDAFFATIAADGATAAGDLVKRPGDLPTQDGQYPNLKARVAAENRVSQGRGTVLFRTSTTIRLIGEVSAPAAIGDVASSTVEAQLWALKRQAEIAIINSYPLFAMIEQLASIQTQLVYTSEQATHLAGIQSDYTFEFIESEDDFAPIASVDLDGMDVTVPTYPGLGSTIDLPQ